MSVGLACASCHGDPSRYFKHNIGSHNSAHLFIQNISKEFEKKTLNYEIIYDIPTENMVTIRIMFLQIFFKDDLN